MFKSTFISCLALLILSTNAIAGNLIIRGEVHVPDGTKISFTVPLDVLEAIKTSGLSAMVNDKETLNGLVDSLIGDIASINGKNLVDINVDKHGVTVKVDEVDEDQPEEANFIHLNISPAGDNAPDIELRIPKGIVYLAAFIGNQFMEKHGEELVELIKTQIEMNHRPSDKPQVHSDMSKSPGNPKELWDDDNDDQDSDKGEKFAPQEKREEIDAEKLVKKILEEILKERK